MRYVPGIMVILLLVAAGFMTAGDCREEQVMSKDQARCLFNCTLALEKEGRTGAAVNLRFSLKNMSDSTLYVLTWYTPLEGLYGDIFRITRDGGERIPYRGIMAKRGNPTVEDYIAVEPGKAVSAVVDLAEAYDLSQTGDYRVEFSGTLPDVCKDKQLIPRKQADHKPYSITCNAIDFKIAAEPDHD